jgi:DNA polymerase I-like protein with 3'-5' exonuclease and polymerase domains
MQYSLERQMLMIWLRDGGVIWDTMIAEYLLTGQEAQFISLDKLSEQNGGTLKDNRLKEDYWEKDIDTADIPMEIVVPYLQEDLRNTAINYMAQLDKIESIRGNKRDYFYALIAVQMEALLATTMIEYNGIHFSIPTAADAAADLAIKHDQKEDFLKGTMAKWIEINNNQSLPKVTPDDVNPGSMQQLGTVIMGGAFKYTKKMFVRDEHGNKVKYKGGMKKGQAKERNEDLIIHVEGMLAHKATDVKKTPNGNYQLDEIALKKLLKHSYVNVAEVVKDFIKGILTYRSLAKELSTSYMGLLELTWPTDSCIHGNMNHCSTNTGRLSSSAPNQQNFSAKEAKE